MANDNNIQTKTNEFFLKSLSVPQGEVKKVSRLWMFLAVFSLAIAGLFSLPPVVLRGTFFKSMFDIKYIFDTSLIIHVNMSVLIWMLSIAGMLWTLISSRKWTVIHNVAVYTALAGTVLMALSPFLGDGVPIKNNYIPILQNIWFIVGLSIFGAAILISAITTIFDYAELSTSVLAVAIRSSAVIVIIAFVCFFFAHKNMPPASDIDTHIFYEWLFWGGGHILQFVYTILMVITWIYISLSNGCRSILSAKTLALVLLANIILVIPAPLVYWYYSDIQYTMPFFTYHMRYFGGISAIIIGLPILYTLFKSRKKNTKSYSVSNSCILLSILLFFYGGLLAFAITGVNVVIPAHYHGSIVGVTLAFMGLIYHLLNKYDYERPQGKIAKLQPWVYGVGQFMHVTGLAWMGGYGALRKAAGSADSIDTVFGKAMFFSGGALAILGGLLFVIVVGGVILKKGKGNDG